MSLVGGGCDFSTESGSQDPARRALRPLLDGDSRPAALPEPVRHDGAGGRPGPITSPLFAVVGLGSARAGPRRTHSYRRIASPQPARAASLAVFGVVVGSPRTARRPPVVAGEG